jgi:hypothetical protein
VLHFVVELKVLLEEGFLLAFDALVGKEEF